jgi:hypothetical protein
MGPLDWPMCRRMPVRTGNVADLRVRQLRKFVPIHFLHDPLLNRSLALLVYCRFLCQLRGQVSIKHSRESPNFETDKLFRFQCDGRKNPHAISRRCISSSLGHPDVRKYRFIALIRETVTNQMISCLTAQHGLPVRRLVVGFDCLCHRSDPVHLLFQGRSGTKEVYSSSTCEDLDDHTHQFGCAHFTL